MSPKPDYYLCLRKGSTIHPINHLLYMNHIEMSVSQNEEKGIKQPKTQQI